MPAKDFFQGVFTVDLAPDELIVGVRFTPVRTGGLRAVASARLSLRDCRRGRGARRGGQRDPGRTRRRHRRRAVRDAADRGGKALTGKPANAATVAEAAALATIDEVNSDLHGSEEYRRAMMPVFTRRALEGALARV